MMNNTLDLKHHPWLALGRCSVLCLGGLLGSSCESKLEIKTKPAVMVDATDSKATGPDTESTVNSNTDVEVTSASKVVAKSGDPVTLTGKNFHAGMSVTIDNVAVTLLEVTPNTITFMMPEGIDSRLATIRIHFDDQTIASFSLVSQSSTDNLPILIIDPQFVCKDVQYHNAQGDIVTGQRDCASPAVNCTDDGQMNCLTSETYKAAKMLNVVAANIKSGVVIAGVHGTVAVESHSDCTVDGQTSCVAVGPSFAAAATTGIGGKILSGQTIAGVAGTLTLPSAANVRASNGAFGIGGTGTTPTLADCSGDGAIGCVTTSSFKSANMTVVQAGNIKAGATIAGVTGNYPSATYPLSGNTATADLDTATFDAKIKSATNFEWWDSAGNRYVNAGDPDITAANILSTATIFGTTGSVIHTVPAANNVRYGVSVNGVTGTLKTSCRNLSNTGFYDNVTAPGVAGADPFDTVDWFNTPTESPWGTSEFTCDSSLWTAGGFDSMNTAGVCNDAFDECTMTDNITGSIWSKSYNGALWQAAVDGCDQLNWGGYTDWRLPTQMELMTAYIHNMRSAANNFWATSTAMNNNTWTATISSQNTANAWFVYLGHGFTSNAGVRGTDSYKYFCIRP